MWAYLSATPPAVLRETVFSYLEWRDFVLFDSAVLNTADRRKLLEIFSEAEVTVRLSPSLSIRNRSDPTTWLWFWRRGIYVADMIVGSLHLGCFDVLTEHMSSLQTGSVTLEITSIDDPAKFSALLSHSPVAGFISTLMMRLASPSDSLYDYCSLFPNLTALDFGSAVEVPNAWLERLFCLSPKLTSLSMVSMYNMTDSLVGVIANTLGNQLQTLEVYEVELTTAQLVVVAKGCPHLRRITIDGIEELASLAQHCPELQEVRSQRAVLREGCVLARWNS